MTDLEERRIDVLNSLDDNDWLKPIDLGGGNGSHHHNDLRYWMSQGAVEQKCVGGYLRRTRAYRRTAAGHHIIREWKNGKN